MLHTPRLPLAGLLALASTAAVILVTELLPAGLLGPMSASLHVPPGRVGFLAAAYAAAATVAAIPLTVATRGRSRRGLLVGLLGAFAAANLVTALSSSYPLTFAVRVLAGLCGGVIWSMVAGYAAGLVPAARRGRAIAIALSGISVALAGGIPAGSALALWIGWRAVFGVLAALCLALVGWVRCGLPALPGEPAAERVPLRVVARMPAVVTVLSVTGLLLLGHQAMYTYAAAYASRAGIERPSVVLLVFGICAVAGIVVAGAVVDRRPRESTLAATGLVALALLTIGLAGRHPAVLVGAVGVWGVAFGGVPTLLQSALVTAAGPPNADVATSLQTTVYNAGVAAGSAAGGIVLDDAGAGWLPWLALPVVLAALLTLAVRRGPRAGP